MSTYPFWDVRHLPLFAEAMLDSLEGLEPEKK